MGDAVVFFFTGVIRVAKTTVGEALSLPVSSEGKVLICKLLSEMASARTASLFVELLTEVVLFGVAVGEGGLVGFAVGAGVGVFVGIGVSVGKVSTIGIELAFDSSLL